MRNSVIVFVEFKKRIIHQMHPVLNFSALCVKETQRVFSVSGCDVEDDFLICSAATAPAGCEGKYHHYSEDHN